MNKKNLLISLNKREINGVLKLNKPLKSFSLSSLIGVDRFLDTFLGFSVGLDFIISLSFESIETDNFYTNSYKNVFLIFNTSPIFYEAKVNIFHKIYLGLFQNIGMHFHFFQNISNIDFFVVLISETETDFINIFFGNMPQLSCLNCQNKCCKRHGIIARFSYQFPISNIFYKNKLHQVTAIYPQENTLIVVIADCEAHIRFVTVVFSQSITQPYSYPSSTFPFSIKMNSGKIIENECNCFYDNRQFNFDISPNKNDTNLCLKSTMSPKPTLYSATCQCCLSSNCSDDDVGSSHKQLSTDYLKLSHEITVRNIQHRRALLPLRQSVYTCKPCCKKTFLTDIHASYQSLLLYKYDNPLNNQLTTEYDPIHGEILGANTPDDVGSYHWTSNLSNMCEAVVITEELVYNTSNWVKESLSDSTVHCLSIATGKLELANKLLVHLADEVTNLSYLLELDINTGSVKYILKRETSLKFCDFVTKAKHGENQMLSDLNNDLQVTKGKSLDVITDHNGIIELKH